MYEKWIGASKLFWLGLLTFLISVLTYAGGQEFIQQYPIVVTIIGAVVGIATIALRFFTDRPVTLTRR